MFDDLQLPIEFTAAGDTPEEQKTNLKIVKPSPGFEPASELVVEIILKDANVTVMDFNAQKVVTRFQIDGLWHASAPMDREIGDYILATLKQLAGLDYRERRQRQEGEFSTLYKKQKQKLKLYLRGSRPANASRYTSTTNDHRSTKLSTWACERECSISYDQFSMIKTLEWFLLVAFLAKDTRRLGEAFWMPVIV